MVKKVLKYVIVIIFLFSLCCYATDPSSDLTGNEVTPNTNQEEMDKNTNQNQEENDVHTNTTDQTEEKKGDTNKKNPTTTSTTSKGTSSNKTQTTTENHEEKSKVADLKTLKVDVEGLTPEFSKNITDYYLVVNLTVKKINVTATPVDTKAKVTVSGNKQLKEGENTIQIKVTAEDGTVKNYTIYVTRIDDVERANASLKSLKIEKYNVYPSFKSNIYNYNLNIEEKIDHLEIQTETENENAKVEIQGNSNLKEGDNVIEIKVTAEDGTTVKTYRLNTYLSSKSAEIVPESKTPAIVLIIILGICVVALGVWIVIKNRK